MTLRKHLPLILIYFGLSQPARASEYCNFIAIGHKQPSDWSSLLPAIRHYFYDNRHIQFMGSLQLGEWLIVEVTIPEHPDDPPFIFFRGRPKHTHPVWEWEGVGPGADELAIKANPGLPLRLAACFQWAIGNPY